MEKKAKKALIMPSHAMSTVKFAEITSTFTDMFQVLAGTVDDGNAQVINYAGSIQCYGRLDANTGASLHI